MMTRTEFMDSLRRALAGSLTSSTVNENMRYYEEYFDMQIRSGQSEEEVVKSLGDPRLLAKTIIEAAKYQARNYRGDTPEYDEVYEDGSQERESRHFSSNVYGLPGWLLIVLGVVVLFVVIGIVGSVLSLLLPIAIPVLCVVILIRWLQRRN